MQKILLVTQILHLREERGLEEITLAGLYPTFLM